MAATSDRTSDGLQYRYHPLTLRVEQIIASGELGTRIRCAAAVLRGEPVKTTPQDAIENHTVIAMRSLGRRPCAPQAS